MHTLTFLIKFIHAHEYWATLFLFVGVLLEGEVMLIVSGILAHQGALSVEQTLIIVATAAFIKTVLGYSIGVSIARKWPQSKVLKYVERRILSILPRFKERPFWSIFISKFIYGVNHVALIFAGYVNANFKLYIRAEIISTIIWLLGFFGVGYFFSYAAFHIGHNIRTALLLLLIFLVMFIFIQKLLSLLYDVAEINEKR